MTGNKEDIMLLFSFIVENKWKLAIVSWKQEIVSQLAISQRIKNTSLRWEAGGGYNLQARH